MPPELTLFLLRVLSGVTLLLVLALLFYGLWREHKRVAFDYGARQRNYGRLSVIREIDGRQMITGESYPLLPITSLGRSPTNTIPLSDSFASSDHATLTLRDGQWWLEDRRSRNGTRLNEILITQPVVLTDGDIVGIGNLRLRLDLEK